MVAAAMGDMTTILALLRMPGVGRRLLCAHGKDAADYAVHYGGFEWVTVRRKVASCPGFHQFEFGGDEPLSAYKQISWGERSALFASSACGGEILFRVVDLFTLSVLFRGSQSK